MILFFKQKFSRLMHQLKRPGPEKVEKVSLWSPKKSLSSQQCQERPLTISFNDITAGARAAGLPVAVAEDSARRPDLGDYFQRYLKGK